MIQRSQTIYLLLAAICGVLTFFLPLAYFMIDDAVQGVYTMFGLQAGEGGEMLSSGAYVFPAWAMGALSVVIPFIAIFLYRNRPVQGKVARLAYLVNLGYAVYLFFAVEELKAEFFPSAKVLFHVGFYAPVAAIAFAFLAGRGIKKDEELVKSLDRLR